MSMQPDEAVLSIVGPSCGHQHHVQKAIPANKLALYVQLDLSFA